MEGTCQIGVKSKELLYCTFGSSDAHAHVLRHLARFRAQHTDPTRGGSPGKVADIGNGSNPELPDSELDVFSDGRGAS